MRYLLILFICPFYGQVLHHQMLSSQGTFTELQNGMVVMQTIGQYSITGTSSNGYVVMQGFQQSFWNNYIASNPMESIKTSTYPNPFIETVHFEFSKVISEVVTINVFDISGRLVFEQKKKPENTILTIILPLLPTAQYLVRLSTSNFSYFTKIIKL